MRTVAYKCPCCASPLTFDGDSGKMKCIACANIYEVADIEALFAPQEESGVDFETPSETFGAQDQAQIQGYNCQTCGAELITEGTTTATECPYCGSPTVLPERIEGGVKPEQVIPFTLTKEQGLNVPTYDGDNSHGGGDYVLGAPLSLAKLAFYALTEWLVRFVFMLPDLLKTYIETGTF